MNKEKSGYMYQVVGMYYSDDNHGSVPLIAAYDALRFIFNKYRFKLSPTDFSDPKVDLVNKFEKHYEEVSKLFGYKLSPPENMINGLGYNFLQQKQYDKAGGLFKINVANYPESFNVYDSYGDYFLAIGDKSKAIDYFKKAVSIKENPDSRKKLDKLLSEQ